MIQPSVPAAAPGLTKMAMTGEGETPGAAESSKTLDFSAVLALEGKSSLPPEALRKGAALPEEGLPGPAGKAAAGGKTLPSALPDDFAALAALTAGAEDSATDPEAASATLDGSTQMPTQADQPLPLPVPSLTSQPAPEETPTPSPQGSPATPLRPEALANAGLANALQQLADHRNAASSGMGPTVVAARLAGQNPAKAGIVGGDAPPRRPRPDPAPTEEIRLDLARVHAAPLRSDQRLPGEAAPPASLPADAALPGGSIQSGSATAQPTPTMSTPLALAVRPHEFSALIDRLSAAREALVPQSVAITLAHQDFGPVRLRFRSEESGLSVAMSSADPGFARAAAAMPPPVLPTGSSDQAGLNPQRSDGGQAQANGSHSSGSFTQPRGGSPERRDDDARPRDQAPRPGMQVQPDGRRGIFA